MSIFDRFERRLLIKFIDTYKELPCLWNKKSPGYRIPEVKFEAYKILLNVIKEDIPEATMQMIDRKINSLRACQRKERKRLQQQQRTGSNITRKPPLWYFDRLQFLNTNNSRRVTYPDTQPKPSIFLENELQESSRPKEALKTYSRKTSPRRSETNAEFYRNEQSDEEDTECIIIKEESEDEEDQGETSYDAGTSYETTMETEYTVPTPMVEVQETKQQQFIEFEDDSKEKRFCTEVDDEYDAIGINVAAKLRNLPHNMRILAEKLINDVLYQAQLNALNSSTTISTQDPFKSEPL